MRPVRLFLGKNLSVIRENTFPAYGKAPFPYRGNLLSQIWGGQRSRFMTKKPLSLFGERPFVSFYALVFAEEGVSLNRTFIYNINTNASARGLHRRFCRSASLLTIYLIVMN